MLAFDDLTLAADPDFLNGRCIATKDHGINQAVFGLADQYRVLCIKHDEIGSVSFGNCAQPAPRFPCDASEEAG